MSCPRCERAHCTCTQAQIEASQALVEGVLEWAVARSKQTGKPVEWTTAKAIVDLREELKAVRKLLAWHDSGW